MNRFDTLKPWKWTRSEVVFSLCTLSLCVGLNVLAGSQWGSAAAALAFVIIHSAWKLMDRGDFMTYLVAFSVLLCFNAHFASQALPPWHNALLVALSAMEAWVLVNFASRLSSFACRRFAVPIAAMLAGSLKAGGGAAVTADDLTGENLVELIGLVGSKLSAQEVREIREKLDELHGPRRRQTYAIPITRGLTGGRLLDAFDYKSARWN